MQRAWERANLVQCRENLRRIGVGIVQYARSSGGALPVSPTVENPHQELIQALSAGGYVANPRDFYCPSQQPQGLRFSDERFKAGVIGYYYYSAAQASTNPALSKFLRTGLEWPRKIDASMSPNSWVMSDIWISTVPTTHGSYRKGVNYLMLDGSVGFVTESPRKGFH
jgi:prepilin-type processing-associated H-X9-DG protein